jgi:hypothetical protein
MGVRTRGPDIKAGVAKFKADRAAPRPLSASSPAAQTVSGVPLPELTQPAAEAVHITNVPPDVAPWLGNQGFLNLSQSRDGPAGRG